MKKPIVAIIFGGCSPENHESLRAAQILYDHAIKGRLSDRYYFEFFYLSPKNQWVTASASNSLIKGELKKYNSRLPTDSHRMLELRKVNVIYSTMMGEAGENGNIMGLADILNIPMIGCGIKASSLTLDKHLSKLLVEKIGINTVDYLYVNRRDHPSTIVNKIKRKIGFPCFVKPNNLGTCAFVFKANNSEHFLQEWHRVTRKNFYSNEYLIEKYIDNEEVRVFTYYDSKGKLCTNDLYVTTLKPHAIKNGGSLFNHIQNRYSDEIRQTICKYAKRIFRLFGMKDYARIDFFVQKNSNNIYFNEANTQPFIGGQNITWMEKDGSSYASFLNNMIKRNLK